MLTSTELHWPRELLFAQYLNLVDRMVRNHEVRQTQNRANADERIAAMNAFRLCLLEIAETLHDYVNAAPLRTHRVTRAQLVCDQLLDIRSQPYDRHAYGHACNLLANLILG